MEFVDPDDPRKGLVFNGRLAEDFKLSTGTWVSVGPLRARILPQAAGLAQDVVIAGHDREFVTALVFPNLHAVPRADRRRRRRARASRARRIPVVVSRFH